MSSELKRQCAKCGCSPLADKVKLYRFPKPGMSNTLKCELWAKFMYPNENWANPDFQLSLFSGHKMLCNKHFKRTYFVNYELKLLERMAVPEEDNVERTQSPVVQFDAIPGPSHVQRNITYIPEGLQQHTQSPVAEQISSSHATLMEAIPSPSHVQSNISNMPEGLQQCTQSPVAEQISSSHATLMEVIPGPSHVLRNITNIPEGLQQRSQRCKSEKEKALYAKCRKQMKRICQLQTKIKNMKNKAVLCTLENDIAVNKLMKNLTPSFSLMLQGQLRNLKRKSKGRRWNVEEKIIALRLYKRSPTCYRLLRRLWCLPAPSTLKSLLGNFELNAGVNQKSLLALKNFIQSHPPSDNEFVLMWDEMSIRKHLDYNKKKDLIEGYQDHSHHGRTNQEATHGLVFMVAGIRKKVKQPIAYFLSSSFVTADRLHVLIKEVINKCLELGINIAATVCDMDGVNRRAMTLLGATENTPYFHINNRKIVSMFDVPHLLKCFRNLFLKYDIKCTTNISSDGSGGQGIAKWSHIQEFYEKDNLNPNFVFAPALRIDHLNPNTKQKMKVNLAAQVLSHSVASGLYAKVSSGEITSEALVTAEVVGNIDKLFDCLNADNADLRRGKPFCTNFTEKSPHLTLFKKMKFFFNTLEFIGCKNAPSKIGWVWTLNAIEALFKHLKSKHNIDSLATRRLQQDPLENLFGCVRGNCGSNTNPSTGQFIAGLKTAILANLSHIGKGNCEADTFESVMKSYKEILNSRTVSVEQQESETALTNAVISAIESSNSITDETSGEMQACAFVCGFLLKNIRTTCQSCTELLFSKNDDELVHIFNNFREYSEVKKSLKYASNSLITCVEHVATLINTLLSTASHKNNLKESVAAACNEFINFSFLGQCQEHSVQTQNYIIKSVFYIIVKRFCIIQNRKFSDAVTATKLKKKITILKHI